MQLSAIDIVKILQNAGYQAYWAGGCVRDTLLGKTPKDFDIVTSAKPDQIEEIFEHSIPIGKKFGIIMVVHNGHHFEIATFRSDSGYSDGRRPDAIEFTTPEEDAKRRDFTINGLFLDPLTNQVLDFVEGQSDLKLGLIKFIGNPTQRINEDHLRILRAVRFKNQLGFQYEPETYTALKQNAALVINKVSKERIRDEINLMIKLPKPSVVFEELSHLGILEVILPELEALRGVAQPKEYHQEGDVWTHTMAALDSLPASADLTLRWATLLHDSGKPETYKKAERIRFDSHSEASSQISVNILKRLCFSTKIINDVQWLTSHHMMMMPLLEMPKKRQIHWMQNPQFQNLLGLFEADAKGTQPTDLSLYEAIKKHYSELNEEHHKSIQPFFTGQQIMEITGIKPGPELGKVMNELFELQLDGHLNTQEDARNWLLKKIT